MANNTGTFNDDQTDDRKITINSIDRTSYVARLPKFVGSFRGIIPYGGDNLYPQKVKSIAQRSSTAFGAIKTYASFIAGDGFIGMNTVVNRDGQTIWDIHRFMTQQFSMFSGFALHFNFNLNGEIVEITPVEFEFVRMAKDMKSIVVNNDWEEALRGQRSEVTYDQFDIDILSKVEDLTNYKGQIYYYTPEKQGFYPLPPWDSSMDDAQFEAEAKLYSLSAIQNDYALSGIFAYPKPLESTEEIQDIKKQFRGDKGSQNAGGIKVVGTMPGGDLSTHNWFTPISRNNIDTLHKQQKEDAKFSIYASLRQPPILSGVATSGMFNAESFRDAFEYYNASTESERKDIEGVWNEIIPTTVWSGIGKIEIKPKALQTSGGGGFDPKQVMIESQAALRGSVGGVQGILEIQQSVSQQLTDYDSGVAILVNIFGFDEQTAREVLGTPILTDGDNIN